MPKYLICSACWPRRRRFSLALALRVKDNIVVRASFAFSGTCSPAR